ncbi:MAG: arginine--tRNA ligase [Clostridia bacterium]|nr:arginine--tRNA ligase [Clostridia bacterium]
MDFKAKISKHIKIDGLTEGEIYELLSITTNIKMGDFSLPCFVLAKTLRMSPNVIAQNITNEVIQTEWLNKVEAAGGYVNFYLNRQFVSGQVLKNVLSEGSSFAKSDEGKGKTIVMDYSSVNIAKQMHIGHLSTTAIGNSLNKIYKFLGYKTVGLNYLGDYGIQFGNIIAAHKTFGSEQELISGGIDYVQKMYAKSRIAVEDEDFEELGKFWFSQIEKKDAEAIRLFNIFKELTLTDVKPIFDLLNMTFDEWKGELYYCDKMQPVVEELKRKNLLIESRDRRIVDLEEDGLNVAVIVKEDGSTRYLTRDLAAAIDRYNTYSFDKCLYITAYEQNLHFAQLFKVLEKMNYDFAKNLVHVSYGRVSLPEGKLSSRGGAKALLKDIFNSAIERANEIIENKNPHLKNKDEVAKAVGVGAVIYGALANQKTKDSVFILEDALSFEGETAPYMQYTYARCASVIKKYNELNLNKKPLPNYNAVVSDEAFEIVKIINNFSSIIKEAANKYEPSIISKAVMSLAKNFNRFYHECKIIDAENLAVMEARVELVKTTQIILRLGLNLLGIQVVEEM